MPVVLTILRLISVFVSLIYICWFADEILTKQSLALQGNRITKHYLWAVTFAGENAVNVRPYTIGMMDQPCLQEDCHALFWGAERLYRDTKDVPYWCCGKTVRGIQGSNTQFRDIRSSEIHDLYFGESEAAKHFRSHIRGYNYALAPAVGVVKYKNIFSRGQRTVSVNGKVVYKAPESGPAARMEEGPGQLFFVDVSDETTQRRLLTSNDSELRPEILSVLERYLRVENDLVRTYLLASEIQEEMDEVGDERRVALIVNPRRQGFRVTDRLVLLHCLPVYLGELCS